MSWSHYCILSYLLAFAKCLLSLNKVRQSLSHRTTLVRNLEFGPLFVYFGARYVWIYPCKPAA